MKLVTNFLPSFLFLLPEQGHFLAFPAHFSISPFWAVQFSSLFLLISPLHLFKQYNLVLSSCPFSFYLNSSSKSFCPFLLIFMFLSFKQDIQACSYCSLGKIVISRRKSFLNNTAHAHALSLLLTVFEIGYLLGRNTEKKKR